jgi:hypothetical protein
LPEFVASGWLVEEGIGEHRALLLEQSQVKAARIHWPGELVADAIVGAVLKKKQGGSKRGVVLLENGAEALVDHLPASINEGTTGQVRIFRAAIAERGRLKMAQARWIIPDPGTLPDLEATALRSPLRGLPGARVVPAFEAGLWEEVWHAASSGSLAFAGGEILCSATPAMTLIDVDGVPGISSSACAQTIARAIRWFDIGGSIGIDFPTLRTREERKAFDAALGSALADWPHEATAMNGFGLVQLVARLTGPSLLHRFARARVGLCARFALRVAERCDGAGSVLLLRVHPALPGKIRPEWLEELARRTGKELRIETDPALALEAPSAQLLAA